MNKKYIMHHGIKGQRWGVRRFQNEDGTLTPAGRRRYGSVEALEKAYVEADLKGAQAVLEGAASSAGKATSVAKDFGKSKSKVINKEDYTSLTDDEIRARINRLMMERSYGELTGDTKRVRSGADYTRELLQTVGAAAGIGASIAATILTIKNIKLSKLVEDTT